MKISPMIHVAIIMIEKVDGVKSVEVLSEQMYRQAPEEDLTTQYGIKIGRLGIDIIINDELSGPYEVFLPLEKCEDMIAYPNGMFVTQEFVNDVLRNDNPKTFLK